MSIVPTAREFKGLSLPGAIVPTAREFKGLSLPGAIVPTAREFKGLSLPGAFVPTTREFKGLSLLGANHTDGKRIQRPVPAGVLDYRFKLGKRIQNLSLLVYKYLSRIIPT